MKNQLSKKEKSIIDNLDRMLAGQEVNPACNFLEEKLWQILKTFEYTEEKRMKEQESVAGLMSDISHQIKTPLSALSVHLELAGDESLSQQEREGALRECREQVDKIHFLSEAMFKVVRLENGLISVKKADADLIETLAGAISQMKGLAEQKGLTFSAEGPESLWIPHDPLWTKEALVNIIDNAVKYTNQGGIAIKTEQGAIYTRIDISDTGTGIEAEHYSKVFMRFYRIRSAGTERTEGTGLGLPIAREILRQQGGNITVSSVAGQGSVFSLFLQNC